MPGPSVKAGLVTRFEELEGQGAVCFDRDGRVRLVVSGELADLVDAAEACGVSADEIVNRILEEAEHAAANATPDARATAAGIDTGSDRPLPVPALQTTAELLLVHGCG